MLGTIAALYAVASSWLPLPPPSGYSDTVLDPTPTNDCDHDVALSGGVSPAMHRSTQVDTAVCSRTGASSPSAAVDSGRNSGIADRGVRTTGVNTSPFLGVKRSGNSGMPSDAILPPLNGGGATRFPDGRRREEASRCDARGTAGDGRGEQDEASTVFDLAGEKAARDPRQAGKATGGQGGEPVADHAATQRPGFNSRPQPRFLDDGSYGENRSAPSGRHNPPLDLDGKGEAGSSTATAFQAQAINLASKEYAELRDRAERAERMLETTRGRLCRALEDGASNAAAAAAATTTAAAAAANEVNATAAAAADHVEDDGGDYGDDSGDSDIDVASDRRYREDGSVSTSRRGLRRRYRGRSTERVAPTTAATAVKTAYGRSSSVDGSGVEKRNSPTRNYASSSDIWDGQGHYHTDDGGERRRRRPAREQTGQRGKEEHQRRRRHSSSRCTSSSEARPEERGRGGKRGGSGGKRKDGGGEPKRRRSKRRQQLRAGDLARMREVIARLRITTAELEAERAHRLDSPAVGVVERGAQQLPSDDAVYASGGADSSVARQAGAEEGGGPSAEAVELQQENASLRRKLFGLMALEELEGRAVEKGLLPLTGGGVSGGDFFSYGENK